MHFDALCITQPSGRQVFSFAATSQEILDVAEIPRIRRGDGKELLGYQRPEAVAHIAEIRRYLESPDAVLPNTVVVALGHGAIFEPHSPAAQNEQAPRSQHGKLYIPKPQDGQEKAGFVVDGQQRLAAIASSKHGSFPIFVTAFVAEDAGEQRKQFVLVNRTKPLPQGMIFELLAEIKGHLPQQLSRQRLAASLVSRLNLQPDSALFQKIRMPTCPEGVIKDNSLRRTVVNSLSDGALFQLQKTEPRLGPRQGERDEEELEAAMAHLLSIYWQGVSLAFPQAWALPPKRSRLTHGAGIVAMGYVMDHLYARRLKGDDWSAEVIAAELEVLRPHCAWTEGSWQFSEQDNRVWNVIQNTDRDVRLLTLHLCRHLEAQK